MLDKGMQTIQESLQAEYDELYEHYQVSSRCMHITTCIQHALAITRHLRSAKGCLLWVIEAMSKTLYGARPLHLAGSHSSSGGFTAVGAIACMFTLPM